MICALLFHGGADLWWIAFEGLGQKGHLLTSGWQATFPLQWNPVSSQLLHSNVAFLLPILLWPANHSMVCLGHAASTVVYHEMS